MSNRYLLTIGVFICLLLPKFDLININGFAQGIRYDDLFLLFCLLWIIINNNIPLSIFPNNTLYFYFHFYLIIYGILSIYITNIYSILLPLRWIEYSVFYLIISKINLSLKEIRNMISGYVAINGIFVILQYNQLVGGIYSHGYITDIMGRLSGLTGGSWELPAMLAMFVSSLILDDYYRDKYLRLLLIIIISALMVYLTGTRTGMIVYFIGIGFAIIANYKTNIILILTVCMTGVLFLNQDRISMITSNTFARFQGSDYPYSLQIRLNEWGEYYRHMEYYDYLVGKGIGYSGLHVDGMFAKIFIDMGVVGLILFSLYYTKLLFPYKIIGLITFIYCITIDFFTASKLMFGMYFAIYYIKQQKLQLKKRNIYYENRLKFVP